MNGRDNKPIQMNIRPDSLPIHSCKCGGSEFLQTTQLRVVPALLSPNGQPCFFAAPGRLACAACGVTAELVQKDQPKIVNVRGEPNELHNVSVEGNLPPMEGGKE